MDHAAPLNAAPPAPRDLHQVHWLWIDNTIVDRYGEAIGAAGLGMYAALARYANHETGQCWPSLERLSTQLDCTRRSARRYLHRLVTVGLITLEERPGHTFLITLVDLQTAGEGGAKNAQVPTAEGEQGGKKDTPGVQKVPTRDAKSAPELPDPNETHEPSEQPPEVAVACGTGKEEHDHDVTIEDLKACLDEDTFAELAEEARASLLAEGTKPLAVITPVLWIRMEDLCTSGAWRETVAHARERVGVAA